LYASLSHPYLLSFPTRRSSDLSGSKTRSACSRSSCPVSSPSSTTIRLASMAGDCSAGIRASRRGHQGHRGEERRVETGRLAAPRSEEHTSELQSRENLVCRLLL